MNRYTLQWRSCQHKSITTKIHFAKQLTELPLVICSRSLLSRIIHCKAPNCCHYGAILLSFFRLAQIVAASLANFFFDSLTLSPSHPPLWRIDLPAVEKIF